MESMKTKLIKDVMLAPNSAFSPQDLEAGLYVGAKYNIPSIFFPLDNVELDLNVDNVVTFWEIAVAHKMAGLVNQVVKFLSNKPIDDQWPVDMIIRINTLNREENEQLKKKLQDKQLCVEKDKAENSTWKRKYTELQDRAEDEMYCKHVQRRYTRVRDCADCRDFMDVANDLQNQNEDLDVANNLQNQNEDLQQDSSDDSEDSDSGDSD